MNRPEFKADLPNQLFGQYTGNFRGLLGCKSQAAYPAEKAVTNRLAERDQDWAASSTGRIRFTQAASSLSRNGFCRKLRLGALTRFSLTAERL